MSSVSGDLEMVSWMKGRATAAKAPKVVSRSTKSWPCCWATGATSAAAPARPRTNPARSVSGEARLRITGSRRSTSGARSPRAAFRRLAAAGERVAELGQVDLDRGPGGVVEGVEDLVDLDGLRGGRAERHRVTGLEAILGGAALDLQVLQAQGRARAHDHGRVHGQRVHVLVQLHVDLGVDRPGLRVLDGLDGLDRHRRGCRRRGPRCRGPWCWRWAPGPRACRWGRRAGPGSPGRRGRPRP